MLRDGFTTLIDGARDVLVEQARVKRPEQYPPLSPYGPYSGGYQYPPQQGSGYDPLNMGAYPQTGGLFGLSRQATFVLLGGAALVAVVLIAEG